MHHADSGSGSSVQCIVAVIINYQLQYCEQDQLLCVVLEDEARGKIGPIFPPSCGSAESEDDAIRGVALARPRGHLAHCKG